MASNLKTTKYNDGTAITNVTDPTAWAALLTEAYCSYNNAAITQFTQSFNTSPYSAAYNMVKQGSTLVDLSGNAKNGTISGLITQTLDGIRFYGTTGKVALGNLGNVKTVAMRVKLNSTTEKLLEGAANTKLIHVSSGTLTASDFATKYVNGVAGTAMVEGQWYDIVLTSATDVDFTAATLALNNTTYGNIEVADLRFASAAWTAVQVAAYHNSFIKPTLIADFKYDAVGQMPKSWIKGTGTYAVAEATAADPVLSKYITRGTKYLSCTSAGTIAIPSKQAYGTWYGVIYKGADANVLDMLLTSSKIAGVTDAAQNGYFVRFGSDEKLYFYKTVNGTPTALITSASAYSINTFYMFKLTRTKAGVATLSLIGGALTAWTTIGTATDTTFSTSSFTTIDADTSDRMFLIAEDEIRQ